MPVRQLMHALLALLLSVGVHAASVPDGPYVMIDPDRSMSAWYAEPLGDEGFTKRVAQVKAGDSVAVNAVGSRPAFTVQLRELPTSPAPDEIDWPRGAPVFLMADTHGEFEICTELLMRQGVIDSTLKWTFGQGRLVVLGDVFDRGAHQTEILWLIYKLEQEAEAAGGGVHYILGNHEAMVLTGNFKCGIL